MQDLEIIIANQSENDILNRLDNSYKEISEMTEDDRSFINALILRNKPKKILEIGVSRGGSSIVILNAVKEIENSHLYSIDYNQTWYRTHDRQTGDFVAHYPELKAAWTLYTGGLSLKFIEKIGPGIDFCLIDTVHFNPGEILDFLMVLPFLKEEALVVFHDTKYNTYCYKKNRRFVENGITNNMLMSTIYGKKYVSSALSFANHSFPNIGAIKINSDTGKHIFEIFNLLTIKWNYLPNNEEEKEIILFFEKYYDKIFVDYLKDVFLHHRNYFEIIKLEKEGQRKTVKYWIIKLGSKLLKR
ncbi:MAG: hypothetical protein JWM14_2481 [Chitinophagaceae bacterium]|nr:hypothetical protein [Chitinophagaceae bacterium]